MISRGSLTCWCSTGRTTNPTVKHQHHNNNQQHNQQTNTTRSFVHSFTTKGTTNNPTNVTTHFQLQLSARPLRVILLYSCSCSSSDLACLATRKCIGVADRLKRRKIERKRASPWRFCFLLSLAVSIKRSTNGSSRDDKTFHSVRSATKRNKKQSTTLPKKHVFYKCDERRRSGQPNRVHQSIPVRNHVRMFATTQFR
jgi:hypothetical protein